MTKSGYRWNYFCSHHIFLTSLSETIQNEKNLAVLWVLVQCLLYLVSYRSLRNNIKQQPQKVTDAFICEIKIEDLVVNKPPSWKILKDSETCGKYWKINKKKVKPRWSRTYYKAEKDVKPHKWVTLKHSNNLISWMFFWEWLDKKDLQITPPEKIDIYRRRLWWRRLLDNGQEMK